MRNRLVILQLSLVLVFSSSLSAQTKLGQWRTHLPYTYCKLVEVTDEKVFGSTTGGLFTYNLLDKSVEKLSKIDGLSDNGVSAMRWSDEREILILAYQSSNIDLISDGIIVNMPDIMNKQIPGDKAIYDICFHGADAYLSTGFGIVVINLDKNEIRDTYYIGDNGNALKVNQIAIDATHIYAATDQGLRRAKLDDPFLFDFNAWEMLTDIPNAGGTFTSIASFEDAIFTSYQDPSGLEDVIYYNRGTGWISYPYLGGKKCLEILNQGDLLTVVNESFVNLVNKDFLVFKTVDTRSPRSASLDPEGDVWVADYGSGLVTNKDGEVWEVVPNGPHSTSVFNMASSGNILYTVQGGVTSSWNNQFNIATLETFKDNNWDYLQNRDTRDLITLVIDPVDPTHVYAGSWGYGIHEYKNGEEVGIFNASNSSLQSIIPGGDFVRIGGLTFDPAGNLWVTNSNVAEPISVRKSDGTWKAFKAENKFSDFNALGKILVTRTGAKWGIIPKGNGLFAMDDNGTIDDISDDIYERVSIVDKYGKVITNDVRSLAEDDNGNLWLGTNQGILVIYSPYRLFTEGSIYAQEIIVPRDEPPGEDGTIPGDVLLGEQVVTAIEVDGANRKWLGTSGGGVYLVSDDGLEQVHQFNELNSPMLSDNIIDICIDGVSGEVFFATDKGIISYKGEALTGSSNFANVVVYPNPVRETYEGPIAIKGLVSQTNVKIQDIGGNLVYETESLGGQATWDGTNFRGERVATGVYMIFLSNADGTLTHVTKLLFIH